METILCDVQRRIRSSCLVVWDDDKYWNDDLTWNESELFFDTLRTIVAQDYVEALCDTKRIIRNDVSSISDLKRLIRVIESILSDTKRIITADDTAQADTKRIMAVLDTVLTDTLRNITADSTIHVSVDTLRKIVADVYAIADTRRRIVLIGLMDRICLQGEFALTVDLLGEFLRLLKLDADFKDLCKLIGDVTGIVRCTGIFDKVIKFVGGGNMARINQDFDMWQKEDKVIEFTIASKDGSAKDLSGGSAVWMVSCSPAIVKSTSNGGITIDGNKVTVMLADTDTTDIQGTFYHELRTVDANGNDEVSAIGTVKINHSYTKGL